MALVIASSALSSFLTSISQVLKARFQQNNFTARRAIELAEQRLSKDGWPEYYDGKTKRYIGKQARKYQTWSIFGYLVAKMTIEDPFTLPLVSLEEDKKISKSMLTRSVSV